MRWSFIFLTRLIAIIANTLAAIRWTITSEMTILIATVTNREKQFSTNIQHVVSLTNDHQIYRMNHQIFLDLHLHLLLQQKSFPTFQNSSLSNDLLTKSTTSTVGIWKNKRNQIQIHDELFKQTSSTESSTTTTTSYEEEKKIQTTIVHVIYPSIYLPLLSSPLVHSRAKWPG